MEEEEGSGVDLFSSSDDTIRYGAVLNGNLSLSSPHPNLWHIGIGVIIGAVFGICFACIVVSIQRFVRRRVQQGTYHPTEVEIRTNKRNIDRSTSSPSL